MEGEADVHVGTCANLCRKATGDPGRISTSEGLKPEPWQVDGQDYLGHFRNEVEFCSVRKYARKGPGTLKCIRPLFSFFGFAGVREDFEKRNPEVAKKIADYGVAIPKNCPMMWCSTLGPALRESQPTPIKPAIRSRYPRMEPLRYWGANNYPIC